MVTVCVFVCRLFGCCGSEAGPVLNASNDACPELHSPRFSSRTITGTGKTGLTGLLV